MTSRRLTFYLPRSDGLRRLREEHLRINLTVSLHATTNDVRHELIPGAGRHALAEVVDRSLSWAHRHHRVVTYGYLLLPGVNDTPDDRRPLGRMPTGPNEPVALEPAGGR